jgi:O-antigen/teichoic acid export membrane protein
MEDNIHENQPKIIGIMQNFGSLTAGKILGDLVTFLLFVILSRAYGQKGIGQYSFAIGLTGFFMVLGDFGLYNFSIKEMSRRRDSLQAFFGTILSTRLILSIIVFSLLIAIIPFLPFSRDTKLIIAVIGAYQILNTLMTGSTSVFVACETMHLAALLEFSLRAVIALVGIAIILMGGSLITVLVTFPIVTFGQVVVAFCLITKKYGRPRLSLSWSATFSTLRDAMPYGLASLLRQTSTRSDVVFLGFFLGEAAAGIYNVAYRVVFPLLFLPHFAGVAIFPLASKLYLSSRKDLESLFHRSMNLVILIGIPASAGIWLISEDLINLFFGKTFVESAQILHYLAWLLLFAFLKSIMGFFLMACDRQVQWTKSWAITACINVTGNIMLIPLFGIKGAALASLISDIVLISLFTIQLRTLFGWSAIGYRFFISCIATAGFIVPFTLLSHKELILVIPVSILIYSAILSMFREIRIKEFRIIFDILRGKSNRIVSTS